GRRRQELAEVALGLDEVKEIVGHGLDRFSGCLSLSRAPGAELGERVLEGEREPEERARQKKKKERAKKEKKKRALLSLPPGGSGRPSRADSRRRAGVFRVRAGAETIGSPRVGRERCCPYLHRS
ncbi:hypothetical protein DC030_14785, partial [Enterococcus faecalis]